MRSPINYLLTALICLGCLAYFAGLIEACYDTLHCIKTPPYVSGLVTSIAAVLATNLGAVLGIARTAPQSAFRQAATWNPLRLFTADSPTVVQTTACYVYLIGLVVAAVVWGIKDFSTDNTCIVPVVEQLGKSLAGVIIGALAVSLNVPIPPQSATSHQEK